ncbi:MAG: hypothetical protein GY788_15795 [bacterium]|nr:hypothetical protein [bacterium]
MSSRRKHVDARYSVVGADQARCPASWALMFPILYRFLANVVAARGAPGRSKDLEIIVWVPEMTAAEIREVVEGMQGIVAILQSATTEDRRKVYEAVQLSITYDHQAKRAKLHASPDPKVWSSVRVGGVRGPNIQPPCVFNGFKHVEAIDTATRAGIKKQLDQPQRATSTPHKGASDQHRMHRRHLQKH